MIFSNPIHRSSPTPDGRPIKINETITTDPAEKAQAFLNQFSSVHPTDIPSNQRFEKTIIRHSLSESPNSLTDSITLEEIERGLPRSKNNAVGTDLVNNKMLRNLSNANKKSIQHLFNVLLTIAAVPARWKESIITPFLKPGKTEEDPSSYRQVALFSCLCKMMERILVNRLQWFLETKTKIKIDQAGFRRGCSTTDHLVKLETEINSSFN